MKPPSALIVAFISTISALDVGPDFDPSHNGTAYELDYGYYPWRSYDTIDLISPEIRSLVTSPQCDDGLYTFLNPRGSVISKPGNVILDSKGELVWMQLTRGQPYGLRTQTFQGQMYLTYWHGDDTVRGHGRGEYQMYDSSYQKQYTIKALNNLAADLHDLTITDEGTALITVYQNCTIPHVSAQTDRDEYWIWDSLFQEIDIATNTLIFEWRASDHFSLRDSYLLRRDGSASQPFDFYHINSVQKDELGNYIISSRYTHTVSYINGSDGQVMWQLGGKHNMFTDLSDGAATDFAWQHDARLHPLETFPETLQSDIAWSHSTPRANKGLKRQILTLFDNAAEDHQTNRDHSRGVLLEITYPDFSTSVEERAQHVQEHGDPYTARLIREYVHPQGIRSQSQGSLQVVPSGSRHEEPRILIGYGYNAVYTEFDVNGTAVCDMHFASNHSWNRGKVQSYRAFRLPWVGKPLDSPTAVVNTRSESVAVSWNGATEIKSWVLEHSRSGYDNSEWSVVTTTFKTGFETRLRYDAGTIQRYLQVRALDVNGDALGKSEVIDLLWEGTLGRVLSVFIGKPTTFKVWIFICSIIVSVWALVTCYRRIQWSRVSRSIVTYSPIVTRRIAEYSPNFKRRIAQYRPMAKRRMALYSPLVNEA